MDAHLYLKHVHTMKLVNGCVNVSLYENKIRINKIN